jgi:hypothetical protein
MSEMSEMSEMSGAGHEKCPAPGLPRPISGLPLPMCGDFSCQIAKERVLPGRLKAVGAQPQRGGGWPDKNGWGNMRDSGLLDRLRAPMARSLRSRSPRVHPAPAQRKSSFGSWGWGEPGLPPCARSTSGRPCSVALELFAVGLRGTMRKFRVTRPFRAAEIDAVRRCVECSLNRTGAIAGFDARRDDRA